MKKRIENFFVTSRIFWTCKIQERSDGYYYYWKNWLYSSSTIPIFAGYNKNDLRKKENTFNDLLNMIKDFSEK